MNDKLELRMYFFTIYQLTGIQAGIQAGHSALEYAHKHGETELFKDFVKNHKTWIILNGGTTNDSRELGTGISIGSLNQIADELRENDVDFSYFHEPDLNNALTALCFIADERVFNQVDYPHFKYYLKSECDFDAISFIKASTLTEQELVDNYGEHYEKWFKMIGGEKNLFLRNLLKDKKLA